MSTGSARRLRVAVAIVAAGALHIPFIANAAEPADGDAAAASDGGAVQDAGTISEVTVSARRRQERAQDVPIPIATLGGDALEATGRFRLESLNESLPSTNIQYNNPRQTSIAVRGLGNNPANDALESSVGVYLDDVYLGRASMANLDLIDVDQVALLRGPQGTLFGKNTTAGVLNITTRAPGREAEHTVEASYGDLRYYQVRGTVSQPITDDLGARLSFARTEQGGFVRDVTTGRDLNGSDRFGGRGQLKWTLGERFSLRLIGDYSQEHSDTGAAVLYSAGPNGGQKYYAAVAAAGARVIYDPNFELTTVDGRQHMDVRQGGGSAEATWQLGEYKLTSITAYRRWWFAPYNDGDGTNLDALRGAGQRVDDNQWTQEIRLASPGDRPLSYVVGAYYFNQHQDNLVYTQYGANAIAIADLGLGTPAFANGRTQTSQLLSTKSGSLFAQLTWRPADAWEFAFGLRDTKERKAVSLDRTSTGSTAFVTNGSFAAYQSPELTRDDNNVSGLLSASYKLDANVLTYVSLSRGAKSGGINPTAPVPGLSLSSLYVAPEIANDAELGIKSTLFNRRLVLNANLFWTDVKDYQSTLLLQPTSNSPFQQILSNIGKVRTRGVETDVTSVPVDGLTLKLATSFNDAYYVSYRNAPCSAEQLAPALAPGQKVCDLSGQRLVGAPQWIVNPSIGYSHPVFAGLIADGQVSYSWRSWFFGSADDSQYARVPAYGLLDARYTLRSGQGGTPWSLTLWSNNLFDKRYVVGGLGVAGRLYNYTETPGLPRTYGATINVSF
jgi:iron complex outermembrane receptor protein